MCGFLRPYFRLIFIFLLGMIPSIAFSITELSLEFNYDRQKYGANRENSLISRTYSGSWANYIFANTAIELNYSFNEEITTQNENSALGSDITITSYQNRVENTVYGLGLRQALAGKGSIIRPIISLGYARQFVYDRTDYTFRDNTNGSTTLLLGTPSKSREDSIFGTFSLQISLGQRISLNGSVRTVFPAFDFNKARDYIKYTVGLSIYL